MFVQWCFGFDVYETKLPRGTEVVSLEKEHDACADWDCGCEVLAEDAEDDELDDAVCCAWNFKILSGLYLREQSSCRRSFIPVVN